MSWARVATPKLLNSVVKVDDAVQKKSAAAFDYDLDGVTTFEGCNYRERRLQYSRLRMVTIQPFGCMGRHPHADASYQQLRSWARKEYSRKLKKEYEALARHR